MAFINQTGLIGVWLGNSTTYTTGSIFLSLFILLVVLLAIAFLFRIRLEYTAILILPLLISYMAYYAEFIAVGTIILIYLAIIITKNFIIR